MKLWFYRLIIFSENQFHKVIIAEIPIIILFIILFGIGLKGRLRYTLFIFNVFLSVFLLCISMFYSYYGTIPSYSALENINQLGDVQESIKSLFDWKYILFFIDIPFYLIFKNKIRPMYVQINKNFVLAVSAVCTMILGVNLFSGHSKDNSIEQSEIMGVLIHQTYTLFSSSFQKKEVYSDEYFINELEKYRNTNNANILYTGVAKDKNIIVIQLESFQNFPLNKKIGGQEITPNLNNLISESVYFPNTFQQIGSGNTSDAEFILNTSIYPVGDRAMANELKGVEVPSLPRILNNQGYYTATFHTNDITFWNRNALYESLGFKGIYDKSYFGTEDYLAFGASDEILYEKTLDVIKQEVTTGKIYAHVITMSNHHPFDLPLEKSQLKLPNDLKNTELGNYLNSVNYADRALGKFIEDLKIEGLWENSLIVVYGDHFGFNTDESSSTFEKYFDYSSNLIDKFNIPLVMKLPNQELAGTVNKEIVGQIDVMPTILNLIGESSENKILFGKDVLNSTDNLIGMRFYSPNGTYFYRDLFYSPKLKKVIDINTRNIVNENPTNIKYKIINLMNLSDKYVYSLQSQSKNGEIDGNSKELTLKNNVFLDNINVIQFKDFTVYELIGRGFFNDIGVILNKESLSPTVVNENAMYVFSSVKYSNKNPKIELTFNKQNLKVKNPIINEVVNDSLFEEWVRVKLDENQYWEMFDNSNSNFITVRLKLNSHPLKANRPYFIEKDGEKLEDKNADYIDNYSYSDIYENEYLYISIPREKRVRDASIDSIKNYFAQENYTLYMMK